MAERVIIAIRPVAGAAECRPSSGTCTAKELGADFGESAPNFFYGQNFKFYVRRHKK